MPLTPWPAACRLVSFKAMSEQLAFFSMTVDEQRTAITRMAEKNGTGRLSQFFQALTWGCLALTFLSRNYAWLAGAAITGIAAINTRNNDDQLKHLAKGLKQGVRTDETVEIIVTEWTESTSHSVRVENRVGQVWRYDFVPLGWTPKAGTYAAKGIRIQDTAWPVLLELTDGLIYPSQAPVLEKSDAE